MADTLQERMDELESDAERATETMRRVDPDAAPVRVPLREWRACVRDKAKLEHQIAEEMGQLAQHVGPLTQDLNQAGKMRLLGLAPNEKDPAPVQNPQPPESDEDKIERLWKMSRDHSHMKMTIRMLRQDGYNYALDGIIDPSVERERHEAVEEIGLLLATDKQFQAAVAEKLGPSWFSDSTGMSDRERIDHFRHSLEVNPQFRFEIAGGLALTGFGEDEDVSEDTSPADVGTVAPPAGAPASDSNPVTAPVDDPGNEKDVEAVDVFRVVPPGIGDEPENVPDAPIDASSAFEALEPEIPAVAPEVERAARRLAEQVWSMGAVAHAELYSGVTAHWVDQYLACAEGMNWLVSDTESRIVRRGEIDPRPVTVTKIPNF